MAALTTGGDWVSLDNLNLRPFAPLIAGASGPSGAAGPTPHLLIPPPPAVPAAAPAAAPFPVPVAPAPGLHYGTWLRDFTDRVATTVEQVHLHGGATEASQRAVQDALTQLVANTASGTQTLGGNVGRAHEHLLGGMSLQYMSMYNDIAKSVAAAHRGEREAVRGVGTVWGSLVDEMRASIAADPTRVRVAPESSPAAAPLTGGLDDVIRAQEVHLRHTLRGMRGRLQVSTQNQLMEAERRQKELLGGDYPQLLEMKAVAELGQDITPRKYTTVLEGGATDASQAQEAWRGHCGAVIDIIEAQNRQLLRDTEANIDRLYHSALDEGLGTLRAGFQETLEEAERDHAARQTLLVAGEMLEHPVTHAAPVACPRQTFLMGFQRLIADW